MTIPTGVYFGSMNLFLLVGALALLLRRPVRDFFATRAAVLRKTVESAQAARARAEARAKEFGARLARVETEMAQLKKQCRADGELERQEIIARAERYAEKLVTDTERMLAQEVRRAREQLRATTVDLAIVMAERYLREQVTTDDHLRLARQYVERLGQLQ